MRVTWQRAAFADMEAVVPLPVRVEMRDHMRAMAFAGQGMACTSARYPAARFSKFRHWLVMYRPVSDDHIDVIAVEYNYGQQP